MIFRVRDVSLFSYLAGGGGRATIFFGGGVIIFFLVWGRVTIFFKVF